MKASGPCDRSTSCTTSPDIARLDAYPSGNHIAGGNGRRPAGPATAGWTHSDDPTGMLRATRGIVPGVSCDDDD